MGGEEEWKFFINKPKVTKRKNFGMSYAIFKQEFLVTKLQDGIYCSHIEKMRSQGEKKVSDK